MLETGKLTGVSVITVQWHCGLTTISSFQSDQVCNCDYNMILL